MLKVNTIVRSEQPESKDPKAAKQTPTYRAPQLVEVGKASELLQGWCYRTYRDGTPGYTDYY